MRRGLILAVALAQLAFIASPAAAAKKKKVAPAPAAAPAAPSGSSKAMAELMGAYKWGMSVDEVLAVLGKQLSDRAAPQLAKVNDVYEQTRIRKALGAEVDQVRKSLIQFQGQRTGWDVSIIEGEFLHKDGESMMRHREVDPATGRDQERFFFFKDGKLWKQFIAFNMDAYKGKTFADFRAAMESRYGKGTPIVRTARDGKQTVAAVAWHLAGSYLRAIDLMQFYANFCLAFSDEAVERQMEAERLARAPAKPAPRGQVIDGDNAPINDPNADIIDRITAGEAQPKTK